MGRSRASAAAAANRGDFPATTAAAANDENDAVGLFLSSFEASASLDGNLTKEEVDAAFGIKPESRK